MFNAIGPKALASNLFQFCVVMALFGIMEQYDYLKLKSETACLFMWISIWLKIVRNLASFATNSVQNREVYFSSLIFARLSFKENK